MIRLYYAGWLIILKPETDTPVRVEAISYWWTRNPWYTKVTMLSGKIWHYGPWNSHWAAQKLADILAIKFAHEARRRK